MDSISSLILTNRFISNLVDILEYMTTILCNEKAAEDFYIELENKKDLILKFPRIGTLVNNSLVKKNYKVRKIPINSYNLFYYYDKGRHLVYFVDVIVN